MISAPALPLPAMIETLGIFLILASVRNVRLVAPPENLSILCQDGINIAYWNHSGSARNVLFSVNIIRFSDGKSVFDSNTSEHHINISDDTTPMVDVYYFNLTAWEGDIRSVDVRKDFSYARDYEGPEITSCFMDVPSLNIMIETNGIKFSFPHPQYKQKKKKMFYTVHTTHDERKLDLQCPPEDKVCHGQIQLSVDSIEKCTTLEVEGAIGGILYKTSKEVCNPVPEKGPWPIYLFVVVCVIVLATLVGILLGAQKVIKTVIERSSYYVPVSLRPRRTPGAPCILQPEFTISSCAQTGSTSLFQSPEDSPAESPTIIPPDGCPEKTFFRIPARAPSSDDQPGDGYEARLKDDLEPEPQPQRECYEGSDDDDGYMHRERIPDTSESTHSSVIDIEIAPEDQVSGYGPR
ncbi:uncharacterized protein LOC143124500 isoform X1 [Alosa pseudoharengus]|uniref:uncharacterized protein LOC143124500 isoform X1 n=2 Tax=Alosa pseudoharengus TaxID=34774 RepID=UPI003F8A253C